MRQGAAPRNTVERLTGAGGRGNIVLSGQPERNRT
nr:MAG TPA: hypothetical protein [Caudoviricetes sp.]